MPLFRQQGIPLFGKSLVRSAEQAGPLDSEPADWLRGFSPFYFLPTAASAASLF
jgi:hypothetical protein